MTEEIESIEIEPQIDEYSLGSSKFTDFGNEERLNHLFGKDILFDVSNETWYIWNKHSGLWEKDNTKTMNELVKKILLGIKKEAKEYATQSEKIKDEEKKKRYKEISDALMKWANKCQNPTKIDSCIRLAQSTHAILPDGFNRDLHLFNFANCTLNLDTMKTQPHNRDDRISLSCGWDYDPAADCPEFKKFVDRLFKNHPQKDTLIRWLKMTLGYCLSGDTDQRIIILITGPGSNGKSVLMATIARTFGDYSAVLNGESLTTISRGKVREDLAQLVGKRFVSVSESPRGSTLDEDVVKHITGGSTEPLRVRNFYSKSFDFYPACKIFWSFNHLPAVNDMTPSIWNRIKVVPFEETIKDEERKDMAEILKIHDNERSGILNWLIEGYRDFKNTKNLSWCEVVKTRTQDYHDGEDVIGQFFEDEIELWNDKLTNPDGTPVIRNKYVIKSSDLYAAYSQWAKTQGYNRPWTSTSFGKEMVSRFGVNRRDRKPDGNYYLDMRIKNPLKFPIVSEKPTCIV